MADVDTGHPLHQGLFSRWVEVLRTTNPPSSGELDVVSRWLVLTRAAVLPMTLTAGLVAGLLAARHPAFSPGLFGLALVGILLAHVANNLMNDLFDTDVGLDTADYPRALYAPHPVLSGLISRRRLAVAALAVNIVDLGILVALTVARDWRVAAFAMAGFLLSVAYTAPPVRLKQRGLGELDVLIVWGPLMVGGTYLSATGTIPWELYVASVPYGLLCTAVLMGKHVDKLPWDEREGVRTFPVVVGEAIARRVTQWLMLGFYVAVGAAIVLGALPWPAILVAGAGPVLGRCSRALRRPKPAAPPPGFPIWPLWYAAFTFLHTRRAGALLVIGLALAAALDIRPYGY